MKKAIWVLMAVLALASMSFGQQGCSGVQLTQNSSGSTWTVRNTNNYPITVFFETADGRPAGTHTALPRITNHFRSHTQVFPVWCE